MFYMLYVIKPFILYQMFHLQSDNINLKKRTAKSGPTDLIRKIFHCQNGLHYRSRYTQAPTFK